MHEIRGMPYAPGRAAGTIRHGIAAPGSILVVSQSRLRRAFTGNPAGVIVVEGAPFSHAMIALLSLGVPTVMVSGGQASGLVEGSAVMLDGANGQITTGSPVTGWEGEMPPAPVAGQPVRSVDGIPVELRASISDAQGAHAAVARGAAAIGLVRSEFVVPPDGRRPDEAFFEQALERLFEAARPLGVTLRLIDIAPDKRPAWFTSAAGPGGPLGLQGVRLYGFEPVRSVLHAQLDAIARLVPRYSPNLMVPYVVRLDELLRVREAVAARMPSMPAFGAMAETPAAALALADLLETTDFAALGTNDLMQCLFAADRDLPSLRGYLDHNAPVLYRFLRAAAQNAGPGLGRVQVCGMLPQLPGVLPALLGLGYRAFSVDPVFIPYLARTVRRTHIGSASELAASICEAASSERVRELLGAITAADAE
jgi:phosphoenolpyruvate-protein kinase (PTS system EI component)